MTKNKIYDILVLSKGGYMDPEDDVVEDEEEFDEYDDEEDEEEFDY